MYRNTVQCTHVDIYKILEVGSKRLREIFLYIIGEGWGSGGGWGSGDGWGSGGSVGYTGDAGHGHDGYINLDLYFHFHNKYKLFVHSNRLNLI